MQIENEKILSTLESIYSQDLTAKTHEIAILRAVNTKLQAELDSLKSQPSSSATQSK